MNLNRRSFLKFSALTGGTVLIASYPIFIERSLVQINNYRIPIPRLPPAFEGFTIVQLTDLHYGPLVSLHQMKRVIEKANSIPRDMILCTGDYIHERNSRNQIDTIWPLLSTLRATMIKFITLATL